MALIVQKYGGTSVGSIDRIRNVASRIQQWREQGNDIVVVVSAMSGETNRLVALAEEMTTNASPAETDVILSTGEQVSMALLAIALNNLGVPAISYTGTQAKIFTDSNFGKARIKHIDNQPILAELKLGKVVIVAGFQGVDQHNRITTLGRGGSDTTAVALAASLSADECQIYTDVDGVYTTDPRIVANAKKMDIITFEEMLELSSLGSKVLQIRSVEFAGKYNVPLRVLSSFKEDRQGTMITFEENQSMEHPLISGIAFDRSQARITVYNVKDIPGVSYNILGPIADANINIDMIVQNPSKEGHTNFSFTLGRNDADKAESILQSYLGKLGSDGIKKDIQIAKVSIVGVGMRSHPGVAAKMFRCLAEEGINIQMIATSEIRISVAIHEKYLELAVRALHEAFELEKKL